MDGTRPNRQHIVSGVVHGFVLACGIIYCILTSQVIQKGLELLQQQPGSTGYVYDALNLPYWIVGFAYIVPGIIGLAAAITRNKCACITGMVFSIITLVVMGIFFLISLLMLGAVPTVNPRNCTPTLKGCQCSVGLVYTSNGCSDQIQMYDMSIAALAFNIIAWILTLVGTILSGMIGCGQQQVQNPGIVIHQGHHMTYPANAGYYAHQTPQPGYPNTANTGYATKAPPQ